MTGVRKCAVVVTVLMLMAWVAGPSLAADQGASKSKPPEARHLSKGVVHTVSGTVSALEPDSKTIEVKVPRRKSESLLLGATLTDQTVIREGKIRRTLADLKVGDHILMKFERGSSGDTATTIIIKKEAAQVSR